MEHSFAYLGRKAHDCDEFVAELGVGVGLDAGAARGSSGATA